MIILVILFPADAPFSSTYQCQIMLWVFSLPSLQQLSQFCYLKSPSQVPIFYELVLKKVARHGPTARVCSETLFVEEIKSNRRKINIRRKRRSRSFVEELFVKKSVIRTRYKTLTWTHLKHCSKLLHVAPRPFSRPHLKHNTSQTPDINLSGV